MKRLATFTIISTATIVLVAGCGGATLAPWGSQGSTGAGGAQRISQGNGMKYTVLLYSFGEAKHIEESLYFKENTARLAGWRNLYVIHSNTYSRLFWGMYRTMRDARRHRDRARKWKTAAGLRPYQGAIVMDIPGQHFGPARWNLANVSSAYAYTVVVAIFYDVPDANYAGREQFAVKYCRQLREKGEQAFYTHGQTHSAVTIGLFPESSIRKERKGALTISVVHDPRMQAVMNRYPRLAVNGREERVPVPIGDSKMAKWQDSKSYPMRIPRKKGTYATHRPGYAKPGKGSGNQPGSQPASDLDRLRRRIWGN